MREILILRYSLNELKTNQQLQYKTYFISFFYKIIDFLVKYVYNSNEDRDTERVCFKHSSTSRLLFFS